jgi:AraC family L-rhamnose operon regulatory protein RhaS
MDSIPSEDHFVFSLSDWTQYWGYRSVFTYNHRNYRYGLHLHDFIEINIVLRGTGKHYFDDKVFDVAKGDVFVVPVQRPHGYGGTVGLDVFHLLLHPRFITTHTADLLSLPGYLLLFTVEPYFRSEESDLHHFSLDRPRLDEIMRLVTILDAECQSNATDSHVASESLALYIIALLCRWRSKKLPATTGSRAPEARAPGMGIQRCLEHIHRSYAESVTTADLARVACMERSQFTR